MSPAATAQTDGRITIRFRQIRAESRAEIRRTAAAQSDGAASACVAGAAGGVEGALGSPGEGPPVLRRTHDEGGPPLGPRGRGATAAREGQGRPRPVEAARNSAAAA